MPLSLEEIKAYIEEPQNKEFIACANKIRRKHELHVNGMHVTKWLDHIEGIENDNYKSLREALAQPITLPECNRIITGENKVFSARGGGRFYDFSGDRDKESFKQILKDVRKGQSIQTFMQKDWKRYVNFDPSGILLAEINPKTEGLEITYKSSEYLHDIGYKSAQTINYIIFKPVQDEFGNNIYRVIDDSFDYLIKQEQTTFSIIEEQTFANPWGFVPATFISDRVDKENSAFDTHISEALIYGNDLLLDYTIYKIYKLKQGVPFVWEYASQCSTCQGSGYVNNSEHECGTCKGTGYDNHNRSVADIKVLPIPEEGEPSIVPPVGYVQPDLNTWTKFEETMQDYREKMYSAVWGEISVVNRERSNITAREVEIRENSKESKLNDISENAENVERRLTDIFGYYYFPGSYQGSIINYGRDYYTKSSDELIREYEEGLEKGLPTSNLNDILERYFHTIYGRSPQRLNAAIIEMKAKPFYHWQPEKIQSAGVNELDYSKNLYFDEFKIWYEQNKEKFGVTTLEQVQAELDKWIVIKMPVDETQEIDSEESSGFTQEQMQSQANLRGSVGGVQGILGIQASVQQGTTDYNAAISTLKEIYGFSEEKAKQILGKPQTNNINTQNNE